MADSNEPSLLLCYQPDCGGDPNIHESDGECFVRCPRCHFFGPTKSSRLEVIEAHNEIARMVSSILQMRRARSGVG